MNADNSSQRQQRSTTPGGKTTDAERVEHPWDTVRKRITPKEGDRFRAMPELVDDQPGYLSLLALLKDDAPFVFTKLNHGFWERLARVEAAGINRADLATTSGHQIDQILGLEEVSWAASGVVADLLEKMKTLASPEAGLHFVPSVTPWPLADRVEGTPLRPREVCDALIHEFVPAEHLSNIAKRGFSGNEIKAAVITGSIVTFLDALAERRLIVLVNAQDRVFFETRGYGALEVVEVPPKASWNVRRDLLAALCEKIDQNQDATRPPVVICAAGGATTTWLGLELFPTGRRVQFIDVGGAFAAYEPETGLKKNWTRAYRRQLSRTVPLVTKVDPTTVPAVSPPYGIRETALVELAHEAGVPWPSSIEELSSPMPKGQIPFIENKIYDQSRIGDFLSLSIAANHHANGGPVAALLEKVVARVMQLPDHRRVVAVNSGTSGLHAACAVHAYHAQQDGLRWVTSAFNFFSAQIGPLAQTRAIDCAKDGGFDLDRLKALPLSSYDGVIYTNVFAQNSNWTQVANYCKANGKAFVVDNATGLLDRPASALRPNAPIEAISAHHTKPWGVGEGGFVICSADDEQLVRDLSNFAARLPARANATACNWKMSDLAAAAILDRLERMDYWHHFYAQQERRMRSLVIDAGIKARPLRPGTRVLSARAHTPFLCNRPVDVSLADGPVTLRKYYRPLAAAEGAERFAVAEDLYARIFSLSNAPEMRLASNQSIVSQLRAMVAGRKKQKRTL